ncbi:hypothetical protein LWI29_010611 [Acer saccharum]|uniref:DNA polymerase V n=1 Tax=Acer saccharum TaxID=4024 RepID=A0AA39SGN5_ACESA|nr:hypothetical protein LWI29_010611 [Acer saccharum]
MGSKKRNSNAVDEAEGLVDDTAAHNVVVSSPLKKKVKKNKRKDGEVTDGDADSVPDSVKPMERQKKRKAMDKERHHSALQEKESQPQQQPKPKTEEAQALVASSSGSGMPEFHIGVFKDLALADVSLRQQAAESLVIELREVQKAYESVEKDLDESGPKLEAEKDDGLNDCAPSLRYAVRRLIRGVSSSRECARQGFALGLTLLVDTIPSIKVDSLLKLIVDLLEVSSSMKGQEVRDCLLGRLFAYGALARSGRLVKEWNSDKNTPYIKEFTSLLISLAAKKRYLQEPAVSIILDMVDKLPADASLSHILEAPGVHEWFEGANEVGNPDALLLALRIREKVYVESKKFGKLLPNPFSPSKLFAAEHLSSLVNCLKESTFCQPRVHSVWPVLVNILLPDTVLQAEDAASVSTSLKKHKKSRKSSSSEEEIVKNFQSFCEIIIEGSLLLSSHDRKHLAFDVLLLLFPRLPASFVSIVLSYKLVQCLMDILSTKDSWLYKAAQYFLKELIDWVRNDDVRRVSVIIALQKHSNGKFDALTRTKTVKDLMSEFKTESGCLLFIQNLMNMFVDEGNASDEPSDQSQTTDDNSEIGSNGEKDSMGTMGTPDFLKSWVIESLPSILKHLKLDVEAKFRVQKEILKFLAVQGLFSASLGTEVTSFELQEKFRWPKAATSSALCRMCIEQIQLLLANAQKVEGSHSLAKGPEASDLGSYFMRFLSTLRNIPSVSLFRSLSDEDEKAFKKLQEMETKLSREERNCGLSTDAIKLHALRYLLIQLLLQAFAVSDLLDSSGEDDLDGDVTPNLMDVLVDTLLSLLPQSSAPMRSSMEQTDDSEAVGGVEEAGKELPEDSDDSDGGMDDDAMFRMDTYLAQIFKEKKNQAGSETAQSQLVLFKLRVLSFLEIYLHENPGKPQVLMVYTNLARALVNPNTVEGTKEFPKNETVQLTTLASLLEKSLKWASKPFKRKKSAANPSKKKQSASLKRHKMINSLAQNSTFWILKIINTKKLTESELQRVHDIFQGVLVGYFDSKKSQIKSEFLKEIFRRRPSIGYHLFGFLLEKCRGAKSVFRRVESLDLVMEILKSLVPFISSKGSLVTSTRNLKAHLGNLSLLIKELVTNMPEKQSRRAEVRKFCGKIFQMVSTLKLTKSFLKSCPMTLMLLANLNLVRCILI